MKLLASIAPAIPMHRHTTTSLQHRNTAIPLVDDMKTNIQKTSCPPCPPLPFFLKLQVHGTSIRYGMLLRGLVLHGRDARGTHRHLRHALPRRSRGHVRRVVDQLCVHRGRSRREDAGGNRCAYVIFVPPLWVFSTMRVSKLPQTIRNECADVS